MEPSYRRLMTIPLLVRLGFGSDRTTADAGREMPRLRTEERLIDGPVDELARHDGAGCSPWRLDFTIADRPGALPAAVQALRELGVTVGTCDVRPGAAGETLVDGIVALPPWLDVPAVDYALGRSGATGVRAVPVR